MNGYDIELTIVSDPKKKKLTMYGVLRLKLKSRIFFTDLKPTVFVKSWEWGSHFTNHAL